MKFPCVPITLGREFSELAHNSQQQILPQGQAKDNDKVVVCLTKNEADCIAQGALK